MHIKSLSLHHVAGVEELHLEDLPPRGVIVISGPNESGKSTIMTAVKTVLNVEQDPHQRYTSNSKEIRRLVDIAGSDRPEISVAATVGDIEFELDKKFTGTKAAKADLREIAPRAHSTHGDGAEARLQEILSVIDETLARELFIVQGEVKPIVKGVEIRALTSALSTETGSDADGESSLMERVKAEYDRYFQKSGKEKAFLATACKEATAQQEAADQLRQQLAALDHVTDHVADLHDELARVEGSMGAKVAAVEQAEANVAALAELKKAREEAEQAQAAAGERRKFAELKEKTRRDLLAEVEQSATALAEAEVAVAESSELVEDTDQRLGEISGEIEVAQAEVIAAQQEAARARSLLVRVQLTEEKEQLSSLLARVEGLTREIDELTVAQGQFTVTKQQLSALRSAETALATARAQQAAAAATMTFDPADTDIRVNGEVMPLTDGTTVTLTGETRFDIGTVQATFTPTASSAVVGREVEKAQEEFERLLLAAGVESVMAAEESVEEAEAISASLASLTTQRKLILGDTPESDIHTRLNHVCELLEDTAAEVGGDGHDEPEKSPSVEAARDAAEQARQREESAREKVNALKDKQAELKDSPQREHLASARAVAEQARQLHDRRVAQAEQAEADESLEVLVAAVTAAAQDEQRAQEVAGHARKNWEQAQPELRQEELEGARQSLQRARTKRSELEQEIARDLGRIEAAAGLHEQVEEAVATATRSAAELTSLQSRAAAARRLWLLLHSHQMQAQRVYVQPLEDQINELAHYVFGPEFSFEVDENLSLEQREHSGHRLPIAALSQGAQEQLAVIVRIALADIASRAGEMDPVPIFFDDLMGHSDAVRLARICAVLARAGKDHQVFVFTADEERFASITGATYLRMEDLLVE